MPPTLTSLKVRRETIHIWQEWRIREAITSDTLYCEVLDTGRLEVWERFLTPWLQHKCISWRCPCALYIQNPFPTVEVTGKHARLWNNPTCWLTSRGKHQNPHIQGVNLCKKACLGIKDVFVNTHAHRHWCSYYSTILQQLYDFILESRERSSTKLSVSYVCV